MTGLVMTTAVAAMKYLYSDQTSSYALLNEQRIRIKSSSISLGNFRTEYLCGYKVAEDEYELVAYPFAASVGCWNGPDIIPNEVDDGRMQMSLWHDLGFFYSAEIAAQVGMEAEAVLEQFNIILAIVWKYYGGKPWKIAVAYNVCQWAKSWYHPLKRFLKKLKFWMFVCVLLTLPIVCCSCYYIPEGEVIEATSFGDKDVSSELRINSVPDGE
jgi:hypothetical protein